MRCSLLRHLSGLLALWSCLDHCRFVAERSDVNNYASDVNKDWTCKDKDQAYKDQDKDKD